MNTKFLHPDAMFFTIDVESIGLFGDAFAVGYVVSNERQIFNKRHFAIPARDAKGRLEDRFWVEKNCPSIEVNCFNVEEMRRKFWEAWLQYRKNGAYMACDCAWPVETRFLNTCIWDDFERTTQSPYPLIEISSVIASIGLDPIGTFDRINDGELPKHDPVADAMQSTRILHEARAQLRIQIQ